METFLSTDYYFDWAATAPADSEILKQAAETACRVFGNPSSVHEAGRCARQMLSEARQRCAKVLQVPADTLYFTSGGTESNYLPMLSLLCRPNKGSILVSAIEHPSIREQAAMMKHCGWDIIFVQPDTHGIITPEAVLQKMRGDTAMLCVMAVNNETGAIQPIYDIADAVSTHCAGKKRPWFHTDCVQALGKIPLCLSHRGIDSASMSAHKIRGPRGVGLLYLAHGMDSFIKGGGQENGIRSGTENTSGAFAFSLCIEKYAGKQNSSANQEKSALSFISELKNISGCKILPESRQSSSCNIYDKRFSPWIVQASFKNIPGEVLVRALSEKNIYISTGSACSARKLSRPVLEAMHVAKEDASSAVRFSFGSETTENAAMHLVQVLREIAATY
ncbi:MAG: cysteine desulfurase [Bacteroides sp.]|nr:cysteine desulfurase [Prevotella sp.]MCM1408237.1 cysteine desulfurase [Treponema brennaborense]MCM1469561.1 cysteine desulfurase [Bacteroides sp.]